MAWNYTPSEPTDIDRVRLLIGDTFNTDPQIQDEEITLLLALEGQATPYTTTASLPVLYRAASRCARTIGTFYARQIDFSTSSAKQALSQRMRAYVVMADELWGKAGRTVGPRVGGQSLSQKAGSGQNTDLPQPYFTRNQFTEPGTGPNHNLLGDQEALEFAP